MTKPECRNGILTRLRKVQINRGKEAPKGKEGTDQTNAVMSNKYREEGSAGGDEDGRGREVS
jgi:hypothetical protein